jgi:hypothetical protein
MELDITRFKRLFDSALADALSNDVADTLAIQAAQAEYAISSEAAEVAKAALAPFQAAIDADASEDEQTNCDLLTLLIRQSAHRR